MADQFVQLPTDASNTGKKVQTFENTVGANSVNAHANVLVNSSGAVISPALDTTLAKLTIAQGTALGTNTVVLDGGSVTTAAPSYSNGNISPLSLTTAGALRVDGSGVALPAGTNNIGDVDVLTLPALTVAAAASSTPLGAVSLGNSLGKVNQMKTGNLVTTAVTADQVILTFTVTALKTFYLKYFDYSARLTTFATTATLFGTLSLESPASTKLYTIDVFHAGVGDGKCVTFSEPIPIAAGTVIRVVCTPSAATSFTWKANFGGYEK